MNNQYEVAFIMKTNREATVNILNEHAAAGYKLIHIYDLDSRIGLIFEKMGKRGRPAGKGNEDIENG